MSRYYYDENDERILSQFCKFIKENSFKATNIEEIIYS